jgi:hypothetical protein
MTRGRALSGTAGDPKRGESIVTPEQMSIVEPAAPLRFCSAASRDAHAEKHVLRNREERWQALVEEELLIEARRELRQGRKGKAVRAVARAYEAYVGRALEDACRGGSSHLHACIYRNNIADLAHRVVSQHVVAQSVEAWPEAARLLIVAQAVVRNEALGPYRLVTAYRPWPRLSPKAHARKVREQQRKRKTLLLRTSVTTHDAQEPSSEN